MTSKSRSRIRNRPIDQNSKFWHRLAHVTVISAGIVSLISVLGFKFFSLNLGVIADIPWAMAMYPYAYKTFAQVQILLGFLALAFYLTGWLRTSWLLCFGLVFLVSFLSEFLGTSWGIPFGHYEYTDLLGYKIWDKVPWLIPPSWFFMSIASYRIAQAVLGPIGSFSLQSARKRIQSSSNVSLALTRKSLQKANGIAMGLRIVFATLILVLWDVTLDPAMSHTTPFWVWEQPGSYYGMPALNIFGWIVTGLVIMMIIEATLGAHTMVLGSLRFFTLVYLANLILPLGLLAVTGDWLPIGITLFLGFLIGTIGVFLGSKWSVLGTSSKDYSKSKQAQMKHPAASKT